MMRRWKVAYQRRRTHVVVWLRVKAPDAPKALKAARVMLARGNYSGLRFLKGPVPVEGEEQEDV